MKTIQLLKKLSSILFFISFFSYSSLGYSQQSDNELLPPEQAFALKAWIENDQVIADYTIADGYYLYRDAFEFTLDTDNVEFGAVSATDGKIKNDEFFGEVEIYRNKARVTLPLNYLSQKPSTINIKTVSQGCSDIGVCYPPFYQELTMDTASSSTVLPVAYQFNPQAQASNMADKGVQAMNNMLANLTNTVNSQNAPQPIQAIANTASDITQTVTEKVSSNSNDSLNLLQALTGDIGLEDEDEIPSPDQAFQLSASIDNHIVKVDVVIHPSTYLYKDKVKVQISDGQGHSLGAISLPKGDEKHDEFFGDILVFHDQLKIAIPVITEPNASKQLSIRLGYQGCVQDKICYPPLNKFLLVDINNNTVQVLDEQPTLKPGTANKSNAQATIQNANAADQQYYDDPNSAAGSANAPDAVSNSGDSKPKKAMSEQDMFADIIANSSALVIIGSLFLAGVLLTFTPCVFPMIPILSGIIAGQGENITTRKAFSLSLVYVLAMATTYAIAGAIVGMFGAEFNIQAWFQDPIILSIFAGIFVLLSLSMFGFFDLQMPSFIQSRITEASNKQKGGSLTGVAAMGMFSALIVGPCITAPLVGALIFISQTQDWLIGGMALFALGLGMGLPLLIIGTSAGKFLPKAGTWMDAVKAAFGVGLLAVAIWLLERILPSGVIMILISLLTIISGFFMMNPSSSDNLSGMQKIWKAVGFILVLYGSFYLVGFAAGGKDLIQPLKGIAPSAQVVSSSGAQAAKQHVVFQQIKGIDGLNAALKQHKGKFIMLDFYADWCVACKEMEKYAFTHPDVLKALENVATIQADVTPNDKQDTKLMSSFGVYGPPAIIFYDKNGVEIPKSRVVGEMSGEEFAAHIISILGNK